MELKFPTGGENGKLHFEYILWQQGRKRVAGLDEVGRGPLAGPVVAACVVFDPALFSQETPRYLAEIDDSKKLSPTKRAELSALLRQQQGLEIGMGIVDSAMIDRVNILNATHRAMQIAVSNLPTPPDHLLVDGKEIPGLQHIGQTALVGGDGLSLSIGAASILAKVLRDGIMDSYDRQYPQYGFARHKGYGTAEHLKNLRRFGPCELHRRSFAPVLQPEFEFSY